MMSFRRGLAFVSILALFLAAAEDARAQINATPELENVFRPAEREYRQALSRADKAIQAGEFADAVEELGGLLQDGKEDAFLHAAGKDETRTSLKAEAERLLMKMPQRGRDLYETKYGAEARAMLEAALEDNSLSGLNNVTRSYFQTKAGLEAAILLGRLQLDQGRPLAAALTFRRVASVPGAKAAYDPELSLLLAVAWQQAHRPDDAKQTLATLKAGNAPVMVNAKPLKWFEPGEDPLEWLTKIAGGPAADPARQQEQWCYFRGNETRNAVGKGGLPLSDFRWRQWTADDSKDTEDLRLIARRVADQSLPAIPALQPFAIGDSILMRKRDRFIAVDFETGKAVWEYPPVQSWTKKSDVNAQSARSNATQRQFELQQRMWDDNTYGQVASNGESVFLLDGLRPIGAPNPRSFVVGAGGRLMANPLMPGSTNRLVALDLKKQGWAQWIVGDVSGEDEPKLANVFFLGAPLPVQDQLLVLGERSDGQVHLFTLDAATGKLDWSQQIANMTEIKVSIDAIRRLAGVSPSFSDGLAICPTSGGAVVAVDWAKRSLAWGYAYRRTQIDATASRQRFGVFATPPGQVPQAGSKWIDSAAIIADGAVVLTPTDANELHCLDLLTGKLLWPPQERKGLLENMLYVACVHEGKIIVVGKSSIVALNLKDGKPAWTKPVTYENGMPSGRGVFAGRLYYLPLSTSEILAVNLTDGVIEERVKTTLPFGNLVSHKEDLISLSAEAMTTFYLRDPLKKRVEDLLAKNPEDPWALARSGEILLQEGKRAEALKQLRAAHKFAPEDASVKATLVRMLLTTLREDYASAAGLAPEIEGLIEQPAQKAEFLRLTADGLAKAKAIPEAFEAYLSLALLTAEASSEKRTGALDDLDRTWRVKTDRWLSSRLAALYRDSEGDVRTKLDQKIQTRLNEDAPADRRAEFVRLFAFHSAAYEPRLKVAATMQANSQLLAAENELWPLSTASAPDIRGRSWAVLADILAQADRPTEAALVFKRLNQDFAEVPLTGGKTGRDLFNSAREQPGLKRYLEGAAWPTGKVNVATDAQRDPRLLSYQRLMSIPLAVHQGLETFGQQVTFDQSRSTIVVRDGLGRIVSEATLKDSTGRIYFPPTMSSVSFGHLIVVSMGGEVIAFDSLRRNDSLLWRLDTNDRGPNPYPGYGMQSRQVRNPLTAPRQVLMDQNGKPLLASIAAGPWGVCFQRNRSIVCVNAMTGEPIWERTGYDAPVDIFGDDDRLFIAPTNPGFDKVDAAVLDAWDGAIVDKRKVAGPERRWATCGRNVLSYSEAGAEIKLQLTDAISGKDLWSSALALGSKGMLINGEEAAVLQPNGLLTIIGLKDGKVLLENRVDEEKNLMALYVLRSADRYFVLAGHPSSDANPTTNYHPAPQGTNTQLVTGRLYAFDRKTGKHAWPVPAYVSQHGYVLDQPSDLPVILFLRHSTPAKGSGAKTFTSILCLDKRTGQALLDANEFPTPIHAYEVAADREKARMQVTVFGSSQRTYTLQFTDEPAPPAAPAQLGPKSSLRTGPPGTGVNVAAEALEGLNRKGRPADDPFGDPFGAPAEPAAPRPPRPPAPRAPAPADEDPFK